ncbi:helix-turn-helix transcriptional regulator [Paenibacillus sacheonensis]|uniref:Helix-turn-helix domain-containing protein n=1 Tax=Paenibacillus sacheonensis TaxID=742054 RepID=A0A7X4YSX4_9BACL|nr:helix-turn-helix transcriptional regulator [Paenibacillus sacheonensis]MBM7567744.1 AraC-like DNA-binding protein [Paenibacillus sacheonensis]NBC71982.1 helix-turn-helix domain-containing protein [Paenibacillus sacheonensis]
MSEQSVITLHMPPMPYYITIGLTNFGPGDQHPNRRNLGIFDQLWVVKGALFIGEDDRQWTVTEGQTLLLLPDRYHYSVRPCESETIFYWIHFEFKGTWSCENAAHAVRTAPAVRQAWQNPYAVAFPQYFAPTDFVLAESILRKLSAYSGQSKASSYMNEQRLFVELLGLLENREAVSDSSATAMKLANKTETFLRLHYQEDITNRSLAEALHFHPNYIVRCMKEIYRCSPMDYLHRYRMEQAKLLLLKTEQTITQVAEAVGFPNAPYFSNCFKRYAGISPLRFRNQYAQ